MTSEIEAMYEDFLSRLKGKLGPIDVIFATRLMYLERKMAQSFQPSVKPHVTLTVTYKPDVSLENKLDKLRENFLVEHMENPPALLCVGQMNMDDVMSFSSDSDIEKITGRASPIIRT
ncbi:hypothetical protein AAA799E16_00744 [Marine Group I thaumarchaeote SCGC AAA799-E16]|uniref:Uncharacterized protein n=3 Tax=Marine Group I TaxID=905826 RepID=A0A087S997_9ARCH|nr:hypothetical protein AAA799E16_00744 [Marine Group I thaumarchaeote SCGC AAA799-E16]KFM18438.1 hypothetical protein SCCGRSA3_01124 [Marine Group I thaumarchaeote SCGC RSA3]KFM22301.1 hypothetical protein AAA799B03_00051 [Marine Group I thaumarchaeote SCGC AAA799-B03]